MATELKFTEARLSQETNNRQSMAWLSLRMDDKNAALRFLEDMKPDKPYVAEIKEHRAKRSNDANAYLWKLCGDIAEAVGNIAAVDVYRENIHKTNVYKEIELREDAVDTFIASWGMHGIGWLCQRVDYSRTDGFVIVHAYYGSSTYNTKQMSRLIDAVVEDARALGIETKRPEELESLYASWRPEMRSA